MSLRIKFMETSNLERVHELTQRTNQLNFSGRRYERDTLTEILESDDLDAYVMDCEDRFGSYGTVGFAVVDRRGPRMVDLMFSCRIQSKRVEHAFMTFLLQRYLDDSPGGVYAEYRKTPRNAPSGRVFDDVGFEHVEQRGEVSVLWCSKGRLIPDDGVVHVVAPRQEAR